MSNIIRQHSELHGAVSFFQTNSPRVSSAASRVPETGVAAREDEQGDFSWKSSVLLLVSLLSCRPSFDGKSKNKGICVLERSGFTVKLFMPCGQGQQWPRTVRFSSWLHWRMWRCHSCLPWRCQKILGSWGLKCQARLNEGWVESAKISTCPREVLIIMKISPTMECKDPIYRILELNFKLLDYLI